VTAHSLTFFLVLITILGTSPEVGAQETDDLSKVRSALTLLEAGRRSEARNLLEQVVDAPSPGESAVGATEKGHAARAMARLQLGRMALEEDDWSEAERQFGLASMIDFPRRYLAGAWLGRVRLKQHDFEGAHQAYSIVTTTNPGFSPAWVGLARANLFFGQIAAAAEALSEARAVGGLSPEAALLEIEISMLRGDSSKVEQQLRQLVSPSARRAPPVRARAEGLLLSIRSGPDIRAAVTEMIVQDPARSDLAVALGIMFENSGDPNRAVTLYRIALAADDLDAIAFVRLQRLLAAEFDSELPAVWSELDRRVRVMRDAASERRWPVARDAAQQILARRTYHLPSRLVLIEAAQETGDLWSALKHYRQVVTWLPGSADLAAGLADLASRMGALDLALESAQRAVMLRPDDGNLFFLLASIRLECDETDEALAAALEARDQGVQQPSLYLLLGDLYFRRLEIDAAVESYRRALELDTGVAERIGSFILSSLTTESFDGLRSLLEDHVDLDSHQINTLYALGVMSLREGDLSDALVYFNRVAALAPRHAQVHYNLGQIYLRQGDEDRGRAEMETFVRLKQFEDREWDRRNRAHFMRIEAAASAERGDWKDALAAYRQLRADSLADADDLRAAGALLLEADAFEEAADWYRQALAEDPYDHAALEGLAAALRGSGDIDTVAAIEARLLLLEGLAPPELEPPG